jgi:Leucine-rich repeat (LRR) protein
MKKNILTIIFLINTIAAMSQNNNLFSDIAHRDTIAIALRKYGLKEVPRDIGELKNAIVLVIAPDSVQPGWTIYPPPSAFEEYIDKAPFRYLPVEITTLVNVRDLTLTKLAIKTLPADFGKLGNLERLDLSINKLTIKNEIEKLKELKKLKQLGLFGNRVTNEDILQLKTSNPSLVIDVEDLFKEKRE